MKLEQQVTSLELTKRLKELGVKQESAFYWHGGLQYPYLVQRPNGSDTISAFTVAELGEMLPALCKTWQNINGWSCEHWNDKGNCFDGKIIHEVTEADARAKMLIYLLENKLISLT